MNNSKYWGSYIKKLRKEAHLIQEQLGDKIGVSRQMIGKIENGHVPRPKPEYITNLAAALGKSPHEIAAPIYGQDPPPAESVKEGKCTYCQDGTFERIIDDLEMTVLELKRKFREAK